jgi:hypothetical protein
MVTSVTPVTYPNKSEPTHYVSPEGALSDVYDLDERAAIAIYDGAIPELYADAFARLQVAQPIGVPHSQWLLAIDDAGRFLDQWGNVAEQLQWSAQDIFKMPAAPLAATLPADLRTVGLCWVIHGQKVAALDVHSATVGDRRILLHSNDQSITLPEDA